MQIQVSTAADRALLDDKLVAFNQAQVPFTQAQAWVDLSHVIKGAQGQLIAGINATLYCWRLMYIDILFVDESHRGQGLGKQLLEHAQAKAQSLGGYMAHLDTFDWQAKDFYARQGYSVFGVLENCPPGHTRYYMSKSLLTTGLDR
jgi:GNAT superfamily N-acetyltransferase